jgi:hypothetical protein
MRLPVTVLTILLVTGCGWRFPLWPDTRSAADRAREVEPHCTRDADRNGAGSFTASLVESVEPDYSVVMSSNDRVSHLRGARLHLRPDATATAAALQRKLECHEALVTLGKVSALQGDPFVLRDVWLDIHVEFAGDDLVTSVAVARYDIDDARQVLARARSFAASSR